MKIYKRYFADVLMQDDDFNPHELVAERRRVVVWSQDFTSAMFSCLMVEYPDGSVVEGIERAGRLK